MMSPAGILSRVASLLRGEKPAPATHAFIQRICLRFDNTPRERLFDVLNNTADFLEDLAGATTGVEHEVELYVADRTRGRAVLSFLGPARDSREAMELVREDIEFFASGFGRDGAPSGTCEIEGPFVLDSCWWMRTDEEEHTCRT